MKKYLLAFLSLAILACESRPITGREKGALAGGALGAGLGAIVGNQVGNSGEGIAIGGAMGALSGAMLGNSFDTVDNELKDREERLRRQQQELDENRRLIDELRSRGADVRQTDRGVVISLPDVLFKFDSAELTSGARRTAYDIANAIRGTHQRMISVEGHTDSVGTDSYNQRLSFERARSVGNELIRDGVPSSQVKTRGFGESRPIESNDTSYGRSKNRRVEVVLEK